MKISFSLLFIFLSLASLAQKDKSKIIGYILHDSSGNPVKSLDAATTYESVAKFSDTCYIVRNYHKNGPMIWQQTFRDADLSIPNGRFVWYNENGDIDSTGIAVNGRKDGVWDFFAHIPSHEKNDLAIEKDSVIATKYYNLGKEISKKEYYGDTTENSAIKRSFFKVGKPITELEFNKDTTGKREAEYPHGANGWRNYLTKNLNSDVGTVIPQYKQMRNDRAVVTTVFLVGKDGTVDDVYISNSSGYPFDNEAIRVIENSGKWVPAKYDGNVVTYRQKQRIIFGLYR